MNDLAELSDLLARWTDWPLVALLGRAVGIGILLLLIDRVINRLVRRAWNGGRDPLRRLAWAQPMARALLGVLGVFGVFAPLHAHNPGSAVVLGLLSGAAVTIWGLDSLRNVTGGLALALARPFEMGAEISAAGVSGTVEGIDLTRIRLRTASGETVYLPNHTFTRASLSTPSVGAPALPVQVEVSVPEGLRPERCVQALRDQIYLSAYTWIGGTVHVEMTGHGTAKLIATPISARDAEALKSDLALRAKSL